MFSRYASEQRLKSATQRYAFAAVCSLAMLAVRLMATPALQQRAAFAIFTLAVVLSAAFAGPGPALFSVILSILLVAMTIPRDWLDRSFDIEVALFVITGVGVIWLGRVFEAARSRAESAFMQLERKAADLAESEAHLRVIIDAVPDALVICDEHGGVVSYSKAAEKLFGYSSAEMTGQNVTRVLPTLFVKAGRLLVDVHAEDALAERAGVWKTSFGQHRDGYSLPIEICICEMKSANGLLQACFVRDISSRRATEARLQKLQMELHHMSRLSAVGEMASALAHEINQPLSAIANYLRGANRILTEERIELPAPARDAIRKASHQAIRAGEIIRRLRDFVTHRDSDKRIEFLPKLIEDSGALALVGAREAGIDVRYRLSPDAEWVLADRVQIQQVLVNLIRNALDAMSDCTNRELAIETAKTVGGMVQISISDNGPGVPSELSDTLFQPFVTTKVRGMGIGLSISRSICEAHGGRLWTEPHRGGGAVFCLTLPLADRMEGARDA